MFFNSSGDYQSLVALIVVHFIADQGLQPEHIVSLKRKHPVVMLGHSLICGALAYLVITLPIVFWLTAVTHYIIDWIKQHHYYSVNIDQILHIVVAILIWGLV